MPFSDEDDLFEMRVSRKPADMKAMNQSPAVGRAPSTHVGAACVRLALNYYCGPSGSRRKCASEFLVFSASGPYAQPRQLKWMSCSRQVVVPFSCDCSASWSLGTPRASSDVSERLPSVLGAGPTCAAGEPERLPAFPRRSQSSASVRRLFRSKLRSTTAKDSEKARK